MRCSRKYVWTPYALNNQQYDAYKTLKKDFQKEPIKTRVTAMTVITLAGIASAASGTQFSSYTFNLQQLAKRSAVGCPTIFS